MPHVVTRSSLFLVIALYQLLVLPETRLLAETGSPHAATIASHDRIIFIGDSITGQGQNSPDGYIHLIAQSLKETLPDGAPTLIALGGSGQGVDGWTNVENSSRQKPICLDVKDVDVKATLDTGADVLVVMLGMNDVLSPFVDPEPSSLDQWAQRYRTLIQALKQRAHPRISALATITPCTEDPRSPRNRVIAEMNQRITKLAKSLDCCLLPTSESVLELLAKGRKINLAFHVTADYVHPNDAGHLAIAAAMLRGLDQQAAADRVTARVPELIASHPTDNTVTSTPPSWLVGTGLVQRWNGASFDPMANRTAVDEAVERGDDFTKPMEVAKGKTLSWSKYVPSVDYVGGPASGSIDFTAVTFGRIYDCGYAARWIHSSRARACHLQLSTQTFAGETYLAVWLNSKKVYQGKLTGEPDRKVIVPIEARVGWNSLVVKSNHLQWQWQVAADLLPKAPTT